MTGTLPQKAIDWFIAQGVPPTSIINPNIIGLARGHRAEDNIFEPDNNGAAWFVIGEETGNVFWRPKTGELATDTGQVFALGQDEIRNPGVCALGARLIIFGDPLEWLQHNRRGIVVLRWQWAFEWLRDVQAVAVVEELADTYSKAMVPRVPSVAIIPRDRARRAA